MHVLQYRGVKHNIQFGNRLAVEDVYDSPRTATKKRGAGIPAPLHIAILSRLANELLGDLVAYFLDVKATSRSSNLLAC